MNKLKVVALLGLCAVMLTACDSQPKEAEGTKIAAESTAQNVEESTAQAGSETDDVAVSSENGSEEQSSQEESTQDTEESSEASGAKESSESAEASTETTESEQPLTAEEAYAPVLDEIYKYSELTEDGPEVPDGYMGIWETMMGADKETVKDQISYEFMDLDENGTEELIVYTTDAYDDNRDRVLAAYALDGNTPVQILEGWVRNSYYLTEDHRFFNLASSGAASTGFGFFRMAPNGKELQVVSFNFSDFVDEEFTKIGWFSNNTGDWDKANSEAAGFDPDEVWDIIDSYQQSAVKIGGKTLGEYNR